MYENMFDEKPGNPRKTWIAAVPVLVILFVFGGQILALLPARFSGVFTKDNIETYPYIIYMLLATFGIMFVLVLLWTRYFEKRSLASMGLVRGSGVALRYSRGFAIGLLAGVVIVTGVWVSGGYMVEADTPLAFSDMLPIFILMVCFMVQSGVEEIVFRGWMMNRIAARFGIWSGVIGNSILFCLLHMGADFQNLPLSTSIIFVANCLLFSLFLSLYTVKEKSVWGACAMHAGWNWLFITWFGLPTTGIELGLKPLWSDLMPAPGAPLWLTGGTTGPEASLAAGIVLGLGCLILLNRIRMSNR